MLACSQGFARCIDARYTVTPTTEASLPSSSDSAASAATSEELQTQQPTSSDGGADVEVTQLEQQQPQPIMLEDKLRMCFDAIMQQNM